MCFMKIQLSDAAWTRSLLKYGSVTMLTQVLLLAPARAGQGEAARPTGALHWNEQMDSNPVKKKGWFFRGHRPGDYSMKNGQMIIHGGKEWRLDTRPRAAMRGPVTLRLRAKATSRSRGHQSGINLWWYADTRADIGTLAGNISVIAGPGETQYVEILNNWYPLSYMRIEGDGRTRFNGSFLDISIAIKPARRYPYMGRLHYTVKDEAGTRATGSAHINRLDTFRARSFFTLYTGGARGVVDALEIKARAAGTDNSGKPWPAKPRFLLETCSRLPAWVNTDTAFLAFQAQTTEALKVDVSVREKDTGHAPCRSFSLELKPWDIVTYLPVDISTWPDGEYKATIRAAKAKPLVRGIRKQTIPDPRPPQGVMKMDGITMLFVDDWRLEKTSGVKVRVHPAELLPIKPGAFGPDYVRYRTSIRNYFVKDGGIYARILSDNFGHLKNPTNNRIHYWVHRKGDADWKIVDQPRDMTPDRELVFTGYARRHFLPRNYGAGKFRYYDPRKDGEVDISQVKLRFTGPRGDKVKLGDLVLPARVNLAVWEKPSGLNLILGGPVSVMFKDYSSGDIGSWHQGNDNFGAPRLRADGKTLEYHQTRTIPRHEPFRIFYDNHITDRTMVTWRLQKDLKWQKTYFDPPTMAEPANTQYYAVDTFPLENSQLDMAYVLIYNVIEQRLHTELAYSRDGIAWHRLRGVPFLALGEKGSWNSCFAMTTSSMRKRTRALVDGHYYELLDGVNALHFMNSWSHYLREDRSKLTESYVRKRSWGGGFLDGGSDYKRNIFGGKRGFKISKMWDWYGSWKKVAEAARNRVTTAAFARFRKDGWVSMSPQAGKAVIVTKAFSAKGKLRLNASTGKGGSVKIEVLDERGEKLPQYSGDNAAVFTGDSVEHPLSWSEGKMTALPSEPFKLLVTLQDADIYALEFAP